jgi:hypothetical protein
MNGQRRLILVCLAVLALVLSTIPSGVQRASADYDEWKLDLPANQANAFNYLYDVESISQSNVWAVGAYDASGFLPLIEKYNGTSWSTVSAPSVTSNSEPYGVAAVNASNVWAVGYEDSSTNAGPYAHDTQPTGSSDNLILKFSGISWSKVSGVPNSGSGSNYLRSACFNATNDGWAVGFYYDGTTYEVQALEWNGSVWDATEGMPSPGTFNFLYGVHCVASNDVWAVGNKDTDPLILHYDGSSWSEEDAPAPGTQQNFLQDVSCWNNENCRAVGSQQDTGSHSAPLVLEYDGTDWQEDPTSDPSSSADPLSGVTYLSSGGLWSAGFSGLTPSATMVLKYASGSWSRDTTPNQGTSHNYLVGVTVDPNSSCAERDSWAVGWYLDTGSNLNKTLAIRYTTQSTCSP